MTAIDKVQHVLEWCTKEMLHMHERMNELEVPTHVNGERLSISQRMDILVGAYKSACERVARGGA